MRITSGGDVGIGTTTVPAKLVVNITRTTGGNYDGVLINGIQENTTGGGNNFGLTLSAAYTATANTDRVSQIYIKNPTLTAINHSVRGLTVDKISGGAQGSAAIFLSNDSNAGAFNTISGAYSLYSANTNNSYFAGNVGIGIASPLGRTHVNGGAFYFGDESDVVQNFIFRRNNATVGSIGTYNGQLEFSGGTSLGAGHMVVTSTGNVGIGTTNPRTKLHIYAPSSGNATATEVLRLQETWGSIGDGPLIRFTNYHASGTNPNNLEYNLAGIAAMDDNAGWGGALVFYTAPTGTTGGANLTERIRIKPNGNVLVNTTTDNGYRMYVAGHTAVDTLTVVGNGGNIYLNNTTARISTNGTGEVGINFNSAATTTNCFAVYNGSNVTLFSVARTSGNAFVSGSLGVGTSSPNSTAALQIDSTTKGFLPPRMTSTERAAITSPATGLVVYQTDGNEGLWLYTVANGWRALAIVV
jgi:hypothetical protein